MPNLNEFSRRIHVIGEGIEDNAHKLVRKVVLVGDQTLVLSTPVDTGRARSNWIVSTGTARRDRIEPYSPGSRLGVGEGANAQGALNQGRGEVARARRGAPIIISNNVPYILPLNDGTSKQAPAGFIERAIQAAVATIPTVSLVTGRGT